MSRSVSLAEILGGVALCLGVIALAASLRTWSAQPKLVSVSVKTLIEEERDWLLAQNASETSASVWIDTVATEIETSLQALEAQGYIVVVKEAVLAGDIPDLTETVRASLGARERSSDPVSRSTGAQSVALGVNAPEATARPESFGDALIADMEGEE